MHWISKIPQRPHLAARRVLSPVTLLQLFIGEMLRRILSNLVFVVLPVPSCDHCDHLEHMELSLKSVGSRTVTHRQGSRMGKHLTSVQINRWCMVDWSFLKHVLARNASPHHQLRWLVIISLGKICVGHQSNPININDPWKRVETEPLHTAKQNESQTRAWCLQDCGMLPSQGVWSKKHRHQAKKSNHLQICSRP